MERWCGMITSNDKHMHWYLEMWSFKVLSLPHVRGATNGKQPSRCHDSMMLLFQGHRFGWHGRDGRCFPKWSHCAWAMLLPTVLPWELWKTGKRPSFFWMICTLKQYEIIESSTLRLTRETSDSPIVVVVFRVSFCDLDSRHVYIQI